MRYEDKTIPIRTLEALKCLAVDEAVATVAVELGYDSPNACIAMLKKALGTTPGNIMLSE